MNNYCQDVRTLGNNHILLSPCPIITYISILRREKINIRRCDIVLLAVV